MINFKRLINAILTLYIFLIPLDPIMKLPNGEYLTKYLAMIIIAIYFLMVLITQKILFSIDKFLLILFLLFGITSFIWANNHEVYGLITYLYFLLQFFGVVYLANYFGLKEVSLIKGYIIGAILISIYTHFNPVYTGSGRLTVDYDFNPNYFSGLLAIAVCGLFFIKNSILKKSKFIYYLVLFFLVYTLVLIQSRTALFSLLIAFFIAIVHKHRYKIIKFVVDKSIYKKILYLLIFIKSLTIVLWVSFYKDFRFLDEMTRLTSVFTESDEIATSGRTTIWKNGIVLGNPLMGTGYRTFEYEYQDKYGVFVAPHNLYVETYVTLGLIGTIILLCFIVALYKRSRYIESDMLVAFLTTFLFLFISGIGNDVMRYKYFWVGLIFLYLSSRNFNNRFQT